MKTYTLQSILLIFVFVLSSCGHSSTTHYGEDFIGVWQTMDKRKVQIEIKEQIREGKKREDRYDLVIIDKKGELPKHYIDEGQYNYQLVTADPQFNSHPFKEFIHKNSFMDTIPYLALNRKGYLFRRYKGLKDLAFKRIK